MADKRPDVSDPGLGLGAAVVERAGTGPSMRTRARIMVGVAFLLTLPALLLGVVRAANAGNDARVFFRAEHVAEGAHLVQLRAQAARTSLWAFEAEPGVDSARRLTSSLDELGRSLVDLENELRTSLTDPILREELQSWREELGKEPLLTREAPLARMRGATGRARRSLDPLIRQVRTTPPDDEELRRAHAALDTLLRDSSALVRQARALVGDRARSAESDVNLVGRDLIVLFLFLLFSAPVVLAIGPGWMTAPLVRLRGLSRRIQAGRARDVTVTGNDEVAEVGRALKGALARLESQDHKQRAKIFEMRRALRTAIAHVRDPVLIVGRQGKVDYANRAAANLLGRELHHIESTPIDEVLFAPALTDAIEEARSGDLPEDGIEVKLETGDDRVETLRAELDSVRNQEGHITRVVVVLKK